MSDDLIERLERGVRRQDRKPSENNDAERALAIEAAARIRELESALQSAVKDGRAMLREIYARDAYMSPELKAIHDSLARALRQDEGGE